MIEVVIVVLVGVISFGIGLVTGGRVAGMRFGRTVIHLMRQGVLTEDQGVAIARTVNDPDVQLDHLPW